MIGLHQPPILKPSDSMKSLHGKKYTLKPANHLVSPKRCFYLITQTTTETAHYNSCIKPSSNRSTYKARTPAKNDKRHVRSPDIVNRQISSSSKLKRHLQRTPQAPICTNKDTFFLPIEKYIEQLNTIRNYRENANPKSVCYQPIKRVNEATNHQKNQQQSTKSQPQKHIELQIKKDFSLSHYPNLFKLSHLNLKGDQSLAQYSRILVVNISNHRYFEAKVRDSQDYTNFLKKNAGILKNAEYKNSEVNNFVYFCALDGPQVESETFFWIEKPLKGEERHSVVDAVKQFLRKLFNWALTQEYSYLQGSTIWIVDWRGRVSFIKFHEIFAETADVAKSLCTPPGTPFHKNSSKKLMWPQSKLLQNTSSTFTNTI